MTASSSIRTAGTARSLVLAVVFLAGIYAARLDYVLWSSLLPVFTTSWTPSQLSALRPPVLDVLDAIVGALSAAVCFCVGYALECLIVRAGPKWPPVAAGAAWSAIVGSTYLWPIGVLRAWWLSCCMTPAWLLFPSEGHHDSHVLLRIRFALGMSQITVAGSVAILTLLIFRGFMRRIRYDSRLCPQCHYDLAGNTSGRCPECGRSVRGSAPAR